MEQLPDIQGPDRRKPLSYDPSRDKFIYYDDVIAGKEKIVPLGELTPDQQRKLVIERNRSGPDYKIQVMSGDQYTRDRVIKEIEEQTEFGEMSMKAELSYLGDLLGQINKALE